MPMNGHHRARLQDVTLRVSSSLQGKVKVNFASALASFVGSASAGSCPPGYCANRKPGATGAKPWLGLINRLIVSYR